MQRKKIQCPLCGQQISINNYSKHERRHKNHPETFTREGIYTLDHDDLFCRFCGKECKNKNSLVQHELRCKENPNRKAFLTKNFNDVGHKPWNVGLTKETDERVAKAAIKNSIIKKGKPGHKHTDAEKQNLRWHALKNGLGGFNMRRGIYYNGIKLDSFYEVKLAESLDLNNVKWERCSRFPYHIDGVLHYYTPDFYLPDYDIYLDPKNDYLINNINPILGYKDIDKINQVAIENNIKILVLNENQLSWDYIKNTLL